MGFILELPPTAEPFNAETRRESFYVGTRYDDHVLDARRDSDDLRGAFSIPLDHVPALLVALESVQLNGRYTAWTEGDGLKSDDIGPSSPAVPWTVTRQGDKLIVTGRVVAFVGDGEWAPAQSIELCYRDLADLMQHLVSAR
jgi:hypothetical protein